MLLCAQEVITRYSSNIAVCWSLKCASTIVNLTVIYVSVHENQGYHFVHFSSHILLSFSKPYRAELWPSNGPGR
jgi:hypothetical protein